MESSPRKRGGNAQGFVPPQRMRVTPRSKPLAMNHKDMGGSRPQLPGIGPKSSAGRAASQHGSPASRGPQPGLGATFEERGHTADTESDSFEHVVEFSRESTPASSVTADTTTSCQPADMLVNAPFLAEGSAMVQRAFRKACFALDRSSSSNIEGTLPTQGLEADPEAAVLGMEAALPAPRSPVMSSRSPRCGRVRDLRPARNSRHDKAERTGPEIAALLAGPPPKPSHPVFRPPTAPSPPKGSRVHRLSHGSSQHSSSPRRPEQGHSDRMADPHGSSQHAWSSRRPEQSHSDRAADLYRQAPPIALARPRSNRKLRTGGAREEGMQKTGQIGSLLPALADEQTLEAWRQNVNRRVRRFAKHGDVPTSMLQHGGTIALA